MTYNDIYLNLLIRVQYSLQYGGYLAEKEKHEHNMLDIIINVNLLLGMNSEDSKWR